MITVLPVIPPSSKDLINPRLTPQKHNPISSYIYIPYASKGHIWYSRYVLAYAGGLEAIPGCFPGIGEQFSQYRLS
jgi:hypothetical protein